MDAVGSKMLKGTTRLDCRMGIDMTYFQEPDFHLYSGGKLPLDHYKAWFKELVDFSERPIRHNRFLIS